MYQFATRHTLMRPLLHPVTLLLVFTLSSLGCSQLNKGTAVGAGGGAAAGALIGAIAGDTATGALIGAAVGGTAGTIINNRMDKQAAELEAQLAEEAEVERAGEGILVNFDSSLLFDVNSADLQPEAEASLMKLAESLKTNPGSEILVVGHTDASGADDYNQTLSEQRATAAATYLMEQGVAPSRVEAVGKGETEPIASNDTPEGMAQNRRVEFVIYAGEQMIQEAQAGG
jgi:outer membrane protein OmpA-like peptidoglycan-associated protein